MPDIDLKDADPLRWNEIRRRIGTIEHWLTIEMPTMETTLAHAAELSLGLSSFYALAAAWREHRDPRQLHGYRRIGPSRRARNATRDLPEGAREIVASAIASVGAHARDRDVSAEIGRRLAAAGLPPLSDAAAHEALLRARSASTAPSDLPPGILIDACHVKLPLATGSTEIMPALAIAVATPENRIVAHRVGTDAAPPSARELIDDLREAETPGAPPRPLFGPRIGADEARSIATPIDRSSRRPRLRLVLGADLGGLGFTTSPRRAVTAPRLLRGHLDRALAREDVDAAIGYAVERHNEGRQDMPPYALAETG